jgi:hypothetical protein
MASWALRLDQIRIKFSSGILVIALAVTSPPWARAQEQSNSSQPTPKQGAVPAAPESSPLSTSIETASTKPLKLLLSEGTPVKLKLLHSLNSKTVVEDDPLNFAVAEDVIIKDVIVAKAGSVAIGRVRQANGARTFGRGGQLVLEMQYLKVGRIRVPLRGSQARTGENKKGETAALVALFGLSGLVKHGSEIEVKEGSTFTAYVDQDTQVALQPEQPLTQVH